LEGQVFSGENAVTDAANHVLEAVGDISEKYKLEIGGTIEKVSGGVTYSKPVALGRMRGNVMTGRNTVAGYHTHTSEGSSIFSIDDTVWVKSNEVDLYMFKQSAGQFRVCGYGVASCNSVMAQKFPGMARPRKGEGIGQ
jgi:hypothetical protein